MMSALFEALARRMLTPQPFVVNRFSAAKFLSNTNAQGAGFAAGGDVSGKEANPKNSETGESQNRKPDPGFGSLQYEQSRQ